MQDTLVLFDIGATLITLNFRKFYEEAASLSKGMTAEQFKEAYIISGLAYRAMEGDITTAEYLEELKKIINPKRDVSDDELKTVFSYHLGEPIDEMIKLKDKLHKAGYSVGVFSNLTKLASEMLSKKYPQIFENSSIRIFSYLVGSVKPDPKAYQKITGYKKVIFIDDKESYLKTGIERFGVKGILFTAYIDEEEAMRAVDKGSTMSDSENFKTANSVKDVVEALRYFGIKI